MCQRRGPCRPGRSSLSAAVPVSVSSLVLHTGKRWFIICPVAEHPATEAPESSPPLPLSSLQPEASPGRSSQHPRQACLVAPPCSSVPRRTPCHRAVLSLVSWTQETVHSTVKCKGLALRGHPEAPAACIAASLSRFPAKGATSRQHSGLGLLGPCAVHRSVLKRLCPRSFLSVSSQNT